MFIVIDRPLQKKELINKDTNFANFRPSGGAAFISKMFDDNIQVKLYPSFTYNGSCAGSMTIYKLLLP